MQTIMNFSNWSNDSFTSHNLTNTSRVKGLEVISRPYGWNVDVLARLVVVIVLIIATLVGNITIITVLTCTKRYRKHVTRVNVFIVGLAVGDLTVSLFTMTTEVLFFVFDGAWMLGPVACKVVVYVQVSCLNAGMLSTYVGTLSVYRIGYR